jgi:hypothetical protein
MGWPDDCDKAYRHNEAVAALGCAPGKFYSCEAVLLGKGGDDGLWMRLVGSGRDDFHRCGSLLVAREGIAYQERLATRGMPKGAGAFTGGAPGGDSGSLALTRALIGMVVGAKGTKFTDWVWVARPNEISDAIVDPAVESPHGPYAGVAITAKGEVLRFGVRLAAYRPSVLSAIRQLAGTGFDRTAKPGSVLRTDGAYVYGRERNCSPDVQVLYFDGANAYWFSATDLQKSIRDIRVGESSMTPRPCVDDAGRFVIPDLRFRGVAVNDDRLIHWHTEFDTELFSAPYTEMRFVSHEEIERGWGMVTAPLVEALWPPVASADGSFTAPDIR